MARSCVVAGRWTSRRLVALAGGASASAALAFSFPGSTARCRERETAAPVSFAQLGRLWATIQDRKAEGNDSKSWTARLLRKGPEKCAQKVGEEATEVVIEAMKERSDGLVKESADLLYHLMVLWTSMGIDPSEVMDELARREGTSGVAEKAARPES
mmetsp:Transcript_90385/g.255158  ORF Transcript_90385/g.255158 Transcript_90385/m.255158 type:complete len:157 (+) Transcript_90385:86-556(+)